MSLVYLSDAGFRYADPRADQSHPERGGKKPGTL